VRSVAMRNIPNDELEVPPNTVVRTDGYYRLPRNARIDAFQPHMHMRGRGMTLEAINVADNRTEILSSKLLDANGNLQEINPETVYTIVTIDYLYKLNSGSYAVLQEGKNVTPLNITIRDAVTNYIKAETAAGRHIQSRLDNRYIQVGPGPKQETPPND